MDSMKTPVTENRTKGRPRNEELRQAIMRAAQDLTAERGYPNVTLLDIATRAGTTRQTIYRWWPTLTDVYLEVVAEQVQAISGPHFIEADLKDYLMQIFDFMRGNAGAITIGLLSEIEHNASVRQALRPLIAMRLSMLTTVIEQFAAAQQRHLSIPARLIAETVAGAMWYRVLYQNAPLDEVFAGELTDLVRALLRS